ncbi:hypothetical protein G7Y79_00009g025770 [Physcia stellaris]|nr:hypothetical protein G7Y79_00009g025770 [Physcia stellaris]
MYTSGNTEFEEHLTKLEYLAKTREHLKFGPEGANNPILMQAVAYNIKSLSYYVKSPLKDHVDRLVDLSVAFENPCGTNSRFLTSESTTEFDAIIEAQVNDRADKLKRSGARIHLHGWSALHAKIPAPYERARKQIESIITDELKREETDAKSEVDEREERDAKSKADSLLRKEEEERAAAKKVGVKRA